jgi:hypothetical protein
MFDGDEVPKLTATHGCGTRVARGEEWPAASSLVGYYGTWTRAVEAAADLRYSISWRSSEKVGRPIAQWEYAELRRLERDVAARRDLPEPRLASLLTIRRRLGTWSRALELAS